MTATIQDAIELLKERERIALVNWTAADHPRAVLRARWEEAARARNAVEQLAAK